MKQLEGYSETLARPRKKVCFAGAGKAGADLRISPLERFEAYCVPEPMTGCLLWLKAIEGGYGRFWADGKTHIAHRWYYEKIKGPVSPGLVLDHLCRQRSCVNPEHLEPVTFLENLVRGIKFQNAYIPVKY